MRAFVALGDLTPDDVEVQLVHGVINSEDALVDTTVAPLQVEENYEGAGTGSTARSCSSAAARSATRSASCPATTC